MERKHKKDQFSVLHSKMFCGSLDHNLLYLFVNENTQIDNTPERRK